MDYIRFWVDNCAAQNKNWGLLSFFVYIINSTEISCNEIEIFFFEPGHTFMSADHFHHQVEQSMNNYHGETGSGGGKIYDYHDFRRAIEEIKTKNVKVLEMNSADFRVWKDFSSDAKLKKAAVRPYLSDILKVKFVRGNYNMFYANGHEDDYIEFDFIMKKYVQKINASPIRDQNRGIEPQRKEKIIKNLTPLMPLNRRIFWSALEEATGKLPSLFEEIDA